MKAMLALAARSAWNRRFVLGLVAVSIALSTLLLLGIERLRHDVRQNFAQSVSGTDLIVGARGGAVQLLLYSVFRIGGATNNIRYSNVQALERERDVDWVVPISLGDSHRGFAVVGTSQAYFDRFRYGDRLALVIAQGRRFDNVFEAVPGADVARRLGYRLGDRIVLSHGDGLIAQNDHADKPFEVVGVLAPTATPVDRSVHISLESMEAMHRDWIAGAPVPGARLSAEQVKQQDLTPRAVTAALVGLKSRAAVFSAQRRIAESGAEPLMAILPGVALDELWEVVGTGERALLAMSALLALVSLAGLVAVFMAGLNERRRELSILRAVGAGPRAVLLLLATEAVLVTLAGIVLGVVVLTLGIVGLADWVQMRYGIMLGRQAPSIEEWTILGALFACGLAAGLLPALRAYGLSLADGLSQRT